MEVKAVIAPEVVIKRITRKMAGDGLALKKARGSVADQLGDYFLVSGSRVTQPNADLEKIARAHDCLEDWETVAR